MKNLVYLTVRDEGADITVDNFKTLEDANEKASEIWESYDDYKKRNNDVYVLAIKEEDFEAIDNGETDDWYTDLAMDINNAFDKKVADKGYGSNQEVGYMIFRGNEKANNDDVFDTLEEAQEALKELTIGSNYIVSIGKKDAEMVKYQATYKDYDDFVIDEFLED